MATETKPAQVETKAAPSSSVEPIPSNVIKRFYDDGGRLVREGSSYNYVPKKDLPYPWPILRPQDEALSDELRAEYEEFHSRKMKEVNARQSIRGTFEHLATLRD